ncbi:trypsin-like cysteine/serine peptidase domain-containing protein [Xylaria grammica]|nr:trypsin-like cysteine/serine peptidase domain-containing protein [Xylaria grammica]
MSGSGFLIDDWTVVTVGHLLVNHCGCARGMRIWAGRGGDENTIESRDGMYVAVHNGWFEGYSECNDLAFIRLSEPFNTVNPLEYKQTPITHNGVDAAIYGYPCDLPENSSARGNRLCVSRSSVRYGWSNSTLMLEHEGDTERGNSGGPVVDHMGTVIALHRGWAPAVGGYKVNEAVAINHGGNDFEAFLLILEYMSWEGGEGAKVSEEVKMLGKVKEVGGFAFAW